MTIHNLYIYDNLANGLQELAIKYDDSIPDPNIRPVWAGIDWNAFTIQTGLTQNHFGGIVNTAGVYTFDAQKQERNSLDYYIKVSGQMISEYLQGYFASFGMASLVNVLSNMPIHSTVQVFDYRDWVYLSDVQYLIGVIETQGESVGLTLSQRSTLIDGLNNDFVNNPRMQWKPEAEIINTVAVPAGFWTKIVNFFGGNK